MRRASRKARLKERRQLAALATLLGLMQAAAKLSRDLEDLAQGIGGSLDEIVEAAEIPFASVHQTYVERPRKKTKKGKR